ncbi:MAG TPA: tripartite tricarboxylate transporter substrate binding protein [Burkholderiales bacterium]|jgi:tripartite-type tricarboxylate transporter receptor subunit TctC|nr:tripartite tricarboxylate transporter substrate binding protein [Burkholderiales bacterium]
MDRRYGISAAMLFIATFTVAASTYAQTYPIKSVRVVSPYPPGSSADVIGRIYTPKLSEIFGRQFVVDNRAGAAGNIAGEIVAHAAPDGYTLLLLNTPLVSSQPLYKDLTFDVARDFQPIGMLGTAPHMLVVNPASSVKTVQELIAFAKARPGKLTYASTGTGGSLHLTMEMFKTQTGTNMLHVPYKGSAFTVPELIGGQVDVMFGSIPSLLPHVKSGRIRALGVSSVKRSAVVPDIPTIAESGLPGFESYTWLTLAGPVGTPHPIVTALNAAIAKCVQSPETANMLANQSTEPSLMTPQETAAFIRDEIVKWKKVVAAAGVKGE